ncbi:hypothetical protein FAUST_8551 [Fusarium austroamericanum]|uniref:Short-chain dehydrogenase/reductase n=1 Tax=Fusarium austroamericanum TaxID=282268 RepID=A0AAN5Z4B7_FUSAU|nr:hypothetical protein FAUST_8551 [Fusarium austroamericanum]
MTNSSQSKRKGAGLLHRIASPFRPKTSYPPKYLDLTGKTALVTGTTSGLGLEACRQLLSHGVSQLIMSARTEIKGEAVWVLEMEAYDSVIAFAEHAVVHLDRLDMIILNAGTLESEASVSPYTENETMFQVNYLSTALLAKLLVPVLKIIQPEREPSPLTVITTGFYNPHKDRFSLPDFEDMCRTELLEDDFRAKMKRFRQSKRFLQPYLSMLAAVVNPDETLSSLKIQCTRDGFAESSGSVMHALVGRTLETGAAAYIDAVAVKGKESHGETLSICRSIPSTMGCCKPPEWQDFERHLWDMTELEFHSLFVDSQTLGAKIYNASTVEDWRKLLQT